MALISGGMIPIALAAACRAQTSQKAALCGDFEAWTLVLRKN
jgi:hypothetical protein